MSKRLKVLLTFLILVLSITFLDTNSIFAVGNVSQSWKNVDTTNTKENLLYRTYTTPHYTTVENYINRTSAGTLENGQWTYTYNPTTHKPDNNGTTRTSKWVLNNTTATVPSPYTFGAIGKAFHTSPMSTYSTIANPSTETYHLRYNSTSVALDWNVNTVSNAIANSVAVATFPNEKSNYNSTTFLKLYNTTGTEKAINWGTGKLLTGLTATGKTTQYRFAIVTLNGSNVFIGDNIIHSSDIPTLITKIKENNCMEKCYVSDIIISETLHKNGGYELAENSERFWQQLDKGGYTGWHWSAGMRGRDADANKAMGALLNLYDNIIEFTQFSKREVYVRHINVEANKGVSTSIVRNGGRIASNNLKLTLGDGTTLTGNTYKNDSYQEEFKDVDITQSLTKTALADTTTYKCIGYNVATASSLTQAQKQMDVKVTNGTITSGTSVTVAGNEETADDEVVIIDFYYSEYDKDVYVNHVYVDKDGYVKGSNYQNIVPNNSVTTTAKTTVNRKNTKQIYSTEQYSKKLGEQIITNTAESLKQQIADGEVEYRGYKVSTKLETVSDLIKEKTQLTDLESGSQVTMPDGAVTITYCYYDENEKEYPEPPKEIEGQVFVASEKGEITAECNDEERKLHITSIPSGIKATTGITKIPKYMVGAITSHYTPPTDTQYMNIILKFKMGTEEKTVKYEKLPYRVGYYTITDMLVYELDEVTVYDAGKNNVDSEGDGIFDWPEGKFTPTINLPKLIVELKGISGRTISNNASAIANINNYVSVHVTDKDGNASSKGATNSSLNRVYLTTGQLNTVDANVDGKVTEEDKTFAINKLQEYLDIFEAAKVKEAEKQKIYDEKYGTQQSLKKAFDTATTTLANLKKVYDDELAEQQGKQNSVNTINEDITKLNEDISKKEGDIQSLEEDIKLKEQEITSKTTEVENAETHATALENKYKEAVAEEGRLAALASCIDEIDQESYENLTEEEKEELDNKIAECKANKKAYQEYKDSNIVSNSLQEHQDYVDGTLAALKGELSTLNSEKATLETAKNTAETDLSKLQGDLATKEGLLELAQKEQKRHYDEEYLPAKDAYESYLENEYAKAEEEYKKYVEEKYVEDALKELNTAQSEKNVAETNYKDYKLYKETLEENYPSYKKLYDEFVNITGTNAEIAKKLGLNITIEVQNMLVRVGVNKNTSTGMQTLGESNKNTATLTTSLYDYLSVDEEDIPQVKTERPVFDKDVYNGLSSTNVTEKEYTQTSNIAKDVQNGVRALSGEVKYTAKVAIGSKKDSEYKTFKDNVYYHNLSTESETAIFRIKTQTISKKYKINNDAETALEKYEQVDPINIYTPITASSELETDRNQIIDQRNNDNNKDTTQIIQVNVPFEIDLENEGKPEGYNTNNTNRFGLGYYVKFDFAVHKVYINGRPYKNGALIEPGTWIGMITKNKNGRAYITAQPYANVEEGKVGVVSEEISSYTVRAIAYNATTILRNMSLKFDSLEQMKASNEMKDMIANICTKGSYFAETTQEVAIINRAYNFRITDLKDLSWKNVFRKASSSTTNAHTGIKYYSGTTKWDMSSDKSNNIITRSTSEIGRNPVRTLPLGPYKNTDTTYTKAPKLGYRFSFDMKVTGAYYRTNSLNKQEPRTDKKVEINTKFYYVSKDGKTFLEEYNGENEGIYLFYKNSAGNYIRIDETKGGDYELRFTPNDGYRYIEDYDKSTLSTKSLKLGSLRKITLNYQMATVDNSGSAITYYGEYKLPNSTIAVKVDKDGKYDINKPLKDGYIGVVFDINTYAGTVNSKAVILDYDANTQVDSKTQKEIPNTSQWDYEGFLGYTTYGKAISGNISLKLEKGKWQITQETYDKIKGTVILYDIDQRAATDYE